MNRCWTCQRLLDDHRHYKTCVSRKNWPAELQRPKAPVAVAEPPSNDEESRQISIKSAIICPTCGFEAKSDFGMKSHSRKHGGAE
jgi:hypothetical protein